MNTIDDTIINEEKLNEMVKERKENNRKTIFRSHLIKLIIGVVLLCFSFVYLQGHPAEKTSMLSGITILFQRMNIFVHEIFEQKGALLDNKYQNLKSLKELMSAIQTSKCNIPEYDDIKNKYDQISEMDLDTYKGYRLDILAFLSKYQRLIDEKCSIK